MLSLPARCTIDKIMEPELNCPQEFEIRQPRGLLWGSIVLFVIFVVLTALIIEQTCKGVYNIEQAVLMIVPLTIATLFLGTLSLYSFCRDTFKYTNGEFLCKRVLRRTQKWNIEDVSRIKLVWVRAGVTILFFDKNDKKIATVTDGIWTWQDGRLRTLLYVNNIPIEGDVK